MSNKPETVDQLFDYAIELERAAETLYRQMGKLFAHQHDVAQYWEHYADEERGHASYLERTKAGVSAERLALPADGKIITDTRKCLDVLSRKKLESIHNLEDAYQLATELENSETNAIFEFMITNFSTVELEKSHKFLQIQLGSHIARLETELPEAYKSKAARQNLTVAK